VQDNALLWFSRIDKHVSLESTAIESNWVVVATESQNAEFWDTALNEPSFQLHHIDDSELGKLKENIQKQSPTVRCN
jgi:hypothetical protein